MNATGPDMPTVERKSWSRSTSINHNRCVSICNIPNVSEAGPSENEEDYDTYRNKCIEQILDNTEEQNSVPLSKPSADETNPSHFKALSEDLRESGGKNLDKFDIDKDVKSIWLPESSNFFYQPNGGNEKIETITKQLKESLQLEDNTNLKQND